MLNPSTSNLEMISLDLFCSQSLEGLFGFVSAGFPRLRKLKLRIDFLILGKLASYIHLNRALSKPGIISELVLQVEYLTILENSQLEDYQALGIKGSSIPKVLKILKKKYGIKIANTWEGPGMMVFELSGQGWKFTVRVDLSKQCHRINII